MSVSNMDVNWLPVNRLHYVMHGRPIFFVLPGTITLIYEFMIMIMITQLISSYSSWYSNWRWTERCGRPVMLKRHQSKEPPLATYTYCFLKINDFDVRSGQLHTEGERGHQSKTNCWPSMLDTVGCVIWPIKIVPDMTYNVFGGTVNPTLLLLLSKYCYCRGFSMSSDLASR